MADKDEFVDNDWPGYTAAQPRHGHRWVDILRRERGQYARNDVAYLPDAVPALRERRRAWRLPTARSTTAPTAS